MALVVANRFTRVRAAARTTWRKCSSSRCKRRNPRQDNEPAGHRLFPHHQIPFVDLKPASAIHHIGIALGDLRGLVESLRLVNNQTAGAVGEAPPGENLPLLLSAGQELKMERAQCLALLDIQHWQ